MWMNVWSSHSQVLKAWEKKFVHRWFCFFVESGTNNRSLIRCRNISKTINGWKDILLNTTENETKRTSMIVFVWESESFMLSNTFLMDSNIKILNLTKPVEKDRWWIHQGFYDEKEYSRLQFWNWNPDRLKILM